MYSISVNLIWLYPTIFQGISWETNHCLPAGRHISIWLTSMTILIDDQASCLPVDLKVGPPAQQLASLLCHQKTSTKTSTTHDVTESKPWRDPSCQAQQPRPHILTSTRMDKTARCNWLEKTEGKCGFWTCGISWGLPYPYKSPTLYVSVLEPMKLLVFGMHTQSPKSFYCDVTNKKRYLILCCSTTLEIIWYFYLGYNLSTWSM